MFMAELPLCVRESWRVYSVIQGSLNNHHCSINTLDTLDVKLNIKKNSLLVLLLVENLQKVKLKEC